MRARALILTAALTALVLAGPSRPSEASPCATFHGATASSTAQNRAGLVVQFSDGSVERFCISFEEATISGLDLLIRSGLPLSVQDYGGGSVAVCRIGADGCDYPSKPCFCSCPNPSVACSFWGYYTLDGSGAWKFATGFGAGTREVHDGDVDGWRWGEHKTPNPPPPTTHAVVCASGSPNGASTPPKPSPHKKAAGAPNPAVPSSAAPDPVASSPVSAPPSASPDPAPSRSSAAAAAAPEDRQGSRPPAGGIAFVAALAAGLGLWGLRRLRVARRADPR